MFSVAFENYYFNGNYGLLSVQYKLSSITNICIKMLITTKNYLHFSQLKMSQSWGSEVLTMEVNMHANIILVWNKFTNFTTSKSFMTLISSINESHSLVHASSGFFFFRLFSFFKWGMSWNYFCAHQHYARNGVEWPYSRVPALFQRSLSRTFPGHSEFP